ncbi:hypothetical protein BgiBS90_015882 [Biomphalaria glabrata]|nr:hypothetical protein BgiBS90_015882 [Biomphalaria glabrata]
MVINTPSPGHYGHNSPSPISWAVKNPSLVVLFMATHSFSWISWVVNTLLPVHMATLSPFPRSWVVNTPSPGYMATILFPAYHGQSRLSHGTYGHTFSFPDIMGSQDSVTGHMATHSFSLISWAVKTPSRAIWPHILFPGYHGQSRLRHWAIWPHILLSDIMGSQDFVTSTVYGDTISFSEIMGSKYSVTGPFGHTFSFPDIMGSQDSVTSSTVYGDTISFSEIMDNQYSVTGPYSPPRDQWHSRLRH